MASKEFDEIGPWTEVKLDIVEKYASAYSIVLSKQPLIRKYAYIDAFAGGSVHISKATGKFVPGSPLNALMVQPPFHEYYFIDMDGQRAARLKTLAGKRSDVHTYQGDANVVLPQILPHAAAYEQYARALCLLDPYNIDLSWNVVHQAGQMGTVDIFLNFMVMDINMNIGRKYPQDVKPEQVERMNRFWGDESWREIIWSKQGLFDWEEKTGTNETLARAYRQQLKTVAGFQFVPEPLPMRNSQGAVIYYLYFASRKAVAGNIVEDIFRKYR